MTQLDCPSSIKIDPTRKPALDKTFFIEPGSQSALNIIQTPSHENQKELLENAISKVLSLKTLKPCAQVNSAFSELVRCVIKADRHWCDQDTLDSIRSLASLSETEMEMFWADRIISSLNSTDELTKFPYYENYKELVRREIKLVENSGLLLTPLMKVCMIGTGPLPLTALELMNQRGVAIDNIDVSPVALELCSMVSKSLCLECKHICGDGEFFKTKQPYDLVIVAGLAGSTLEKKQAIINNILPSLQDHGRILLRSAWGARELLYPAVKADSLTGIELLKEYHPQDDVINSVFVYKKS